MYLCNCSVGLGKTFVLLCLLFFWQKMFYFLHLPLSLGAEHLNMPNLLNLRLLPNRKTVGDSHPQSYFHPFPKINCGGEGTRKEVIRNVFWLNKTNQNPVSPSLEGEESLWERSCILSGGSGYESLLGGPLSGAAAPLQAQGQGAPTPLTLLEGGGWSLPLLVHDDQRKTSLEALGWREQKKQARRLREELMWLLKMHFLWKMQTDAQELGRKLLVFLPPCCFSSDPRGTS